MNGFNGTFSCEKKEGCLPAVNNHSAVIHTQQGDIKGRFVTSNFRLDEDNPSDDNFLLLKKFKFLAVNRIEGLQDFHADGVLGLGRDSYSKAETGTELLDFIAKAEEVARDKQFALHVTPSEEDDLTLIFGAVDEKYIGPDPDAYHTINVIQII